MNAALASFLRSAGASVREGNETPAPFEQGGVRVLIDEGGAERARHDRAFIADYLAESIVIGAAYNFSLVREDELSRLGGYLSLDEEPSRVERAVWDVARGGGGWMSPVIFRGSAAVLSERQLDVLRLMAEGESNNRIADALSISVNTIKSHVQAIYTSTCTGTRAAAVAWAFRNRYLD